MHLRHSIAWLLAWALAGCACAPPSPIAPQAPFKLEETGRQTFVGGHRFRARTRFQLVSFDIQANERLRLQRCGEQCRTAKLVGSWTRADFDRSRGQAIELLEAGDYYLWIEQELANGEVGPIQGVMGTFDGPDGILRFASGTTVFIAVEEPPAARTPCVDDDRETPDAVRCPAAATPTS